jgi:polysaccharide export outer membrane protein
MGRIAIGIGMTMALLLACAPRGRPPNPATEEPFRIGREDVLDVSVWRDPELSRVVPVRPDGFISIPLAGEIQAAGKTPAELAEEIRVRLSPLVQEPRVTVMVREVNSARIYVTGEVARPGAYPLRGRVSVLQAIALAGGFTDFADHDGIVVIRKGTPGQGPIPVRYTELLSSREGVDPDLLLVPGDTVVVP